MVSCTDEEGAYKALHSAGYTDIQLTGYTMSCGRDDYTCTGFIAKGPTGVLTEGAVGCGAFFKGCTIRTL